MRTVSHNSFSMVVRMKWKKNACAILCPSHRLTRSSSLKMVITMANWGQCFWLSFALKITPDLKCGSPLGWANMNAKRWDIPGIKLAIVGPWSDWKVLALWQRTFRVRKCTELGGITCAVWCPYSPRGCGEVCLSTMNTTVTTKASHLSGGRRLLQTQCPQTLVLRVGFMENPRSGFDWFFPVTSKLASKLHISHKVLKTAVHKWVPGCLWPTWR